MREWNLVANDPLELTLASDFRLCTCDYPNDHIWELLPGGGDPNALALTTTFGLRAKVMRIFPGFLLLDKAKKSSRVDFLTDPSGFFRSAHIHQFHPNYLRLGFFPFQGISVEAEYWVPDSHCIAGRFRVANVGEENRTFILNLFGQLVPIEGQSLAPTTMQSVNVLAGKTADLHPVVFITGGPQFGQGPYPSLSLDVSLSPGGKRVFTWVQAALGSQQESFEMTRRIAARPWEAEMTKIEMVNASETVDITTGDPDWDAALAFSQKTAFHLFLSPTPHLPHPSFVFARQPDHGSSLRGDGNDYNRLWNGQPALESLFLANALPGAPGLASGLIRNFLAAQSGNGGLDWKPGLAGQKGRWLAAPLLATLAWNTFQKTGDANFLKEIQDGMVSFLNCWFNEEHDLDQDGFPEWENTLHYGFEDHPAFSIWHVNGQGIAISTVENPALAAMLCREMHALAEIAHALEQPEMGKKFLQRSTELGALTEECWDADDSLYHNRDRDSHACTVGKRIGEFTDSGTFPVRQSFKQPVRLVIRVILKEVITRRIDITIEGKNEGRVINEKLERMSFQWGQGIAVATTSELFTRVEKIMISGLEKLDQVMLRTVDLSCEDVSLFLPLWAEIPHAQRAQTMADKALFDTGRFWRPFGIPASPGMSEIRAPGVSSKSLEDTAQHEVHLPWNLFIGEGLLRYGFRVQAAELVTHLLSAIILNLKKQHAFAESYHSETGAGLGERNALQGLAPVGLFLQTLGVGIVSDKRIILNGMNPFPWPVTVKYRGLKVTREKRHTYVTFPNGQTLTFNDPSNSVASIE